MRYRISKLKMVSLAFLALVGTVIAPGISAGEQRLECTLYIAESMDSAAGHSVNVEKAGTMLGTLRRAAYCVFKDGRIADKQFVMVNLVQDGGNVGAAKGFSIYTMENGDSVSAEFTGGWDKGPFAGTYVILGGTGEFTDASGDGSINAESSPWDTTGVVKIVLNVKTPG